MARPALLDGAEQAAALQRLGAPWEIVGSQLRAVFPMISYAQGLAFVASAGAEAQELDHHPTLTLDYRQVVVAVTTHDAGGLTELDFTYAAAISERYPSSKLR